MIYCAQFVGIFFGKSSAIFFYQNQVGLKGYGRIFCLSFGESCFFSIFIDISRGLIYSYHAKDLNISYCKGQGYFKTMSLLHKYTASNFSHVTSSTWHLSNIQTPYFIFSLNEFPTKYLNANELLIIIINSKELREIQMNKFNKTQAKR